MDKLELAKRFLASSNYSGEAYKEVIVAIDNSDETIGEVRSNRHRIFAYRMKIAIDEKIAQILAELVDTKTLQKLIEMYDEDTSPDRFAELASEIKPDVLTVQPELTRRLDEMIAEHARENPFPNSP